MQEGRQGDLVELVRESIRAAMIETHTALPGRIETYDAATQTATVIAEIQREIKRDDGTTFSRSVPTLLEVPVLFTRAGGFSITFPVAAGDKCLIVFAERDISGWRSIGGESLPPSARRHAYADGVAILGLWPSKNALSPAPSSSALEIRSDDGDIVIEVSADGVSIDTGSGTSGVTLDSPAGPFEVTSLGRINLTRGPNELLGTISAALTAIAAITVAGGTPIDPTPLANINAIKVLIDAMRT